MVTLTFLRSRNCIYCKRKIAQITGLGNEELPNAGDVAICFYCGEILVFGNDMLYRSPTVEEITNVHKLYPDINKIRSNIINKKMINSR